MTGQRTPRNSPQAHGQRRRRTARQRGMARRTKIVATLGPASDEPAQLEALLRAGVDVVRSTSATASSTTTCAGWRSSASVAVKVGRPIGVLADLPGPKIRAGSFPEGGVALAPDDVVHLVPGERSEHARPHHRRLPDAARRPRSRRPRRARRRRHLDARRRARRRPRSSPRSRAAAARRAGPVSTCRASACRCRRRPSATSSSPKQWPRRVSSSSPCRSCAAPPTSNGCGRWSATAPGSSPRSRPRRRSGSWPRSRGPPTRVMVARGDLGIDCPLEDVPHLQKRIVRHCVSVGTPGHHGDADAGVDDRGAVADARRGERRRQCRVRRHRRGDAVRRDGDRTRSGARRGDDGAASPSAPRPRRATASGPSASAASSGRGTGTSRRADHRRRDARRVAGGRRRRRGGDPVLHAQRSHGPGDGPLPPRLPPVGLSPDPRTVNALALSWGVESLQVDEYTTSDEMVWFAVETALHAGYIAHGDIVLVLAGAPDRASGAATDVLRIVPRSSVTIWSRGGRRPGRPVARPRARLDGPLGGPAQAVAPARRRPSRAALRPARLRPLGGARGAVRHRRQVDDLVALLDGRPAVLFGHSYGGNVALAAADRHPDLVRAVGVYETPLSWVDWWPDSTAGSQATDERHRPGGRGRAVHAADDRRRALGAPAARARAPHGGPRARRWSGSSSTSTSTSRGIASRIVVPAVALRGSEGRPHHQASSDHLAAVLADCPVVDIAGAKHFGPNTHPDAVAAAIVELVGPSGPSTVTSRPKNVQVVSSTAPATSVARTSSAHATSSPRWRHTIAATRSEQADDDELGHDRLDATGAGHGEDDGAGGDGQARRHAPSPGRCRAHRDANDGYAVTTWHARTMSDERPITLSHGLPADRAARRSSRTPRRRSPRRRPWTVSSGVPPSPRSPPGGRGASTRGPRSATAGATTSSATPTTASGTTAASTRCGQRLAGVRVRAVVAAHEPGVPARPRRARSDGRGDRGGRRGRPHRAVPRPARPDGPPGP